MDIGGEDTLKGRIWDFLDNMPKGSRFAIKTEEQMKWVKEYITAYGSEMRVELTSDYRYVKKHKF
jgi:hypothetical protein